MNPRHPATRSFCPSSFRTSFRSGARPLAACLVLLASLGLGLPAPAQTASPGPVQPEYDPKLKERLEKVYGHELTERNVLDFLSWSPNVGDVDWWLSRERNEKAFARSQELLYYASNPYEELSSARQHEELYGVDLESAGITVPGGTGKALVVRPALRPDLFPLDDVLTHYLSTKIVPWLDGVGYPISQAELRQLMNDLVANKAFLDGLIHLQAMVNWRILDPAEVPGAADGFLGALFEHVYRLTEDPTDRLMADEAEYAALQTALAASTETDLRPEYAQQILALRQARFDRRIGDIELFLNALGEEHRSFLIRAAVHELFTSTVLIPARTLEEANATIAGLDFRLRGNSTDYSQLAFRGQGPDTVPIADVHTFLHVNQHELSIQNELSWDLWSCEVFDTAELEAYPFAGNDAPTATIRLISDHSLALSVFSTSYSVSPVLKHDSLDYVVGSQTAVGGICYFGNHAEKGDLQAVCPVYFGGTSNTSIKFLGVEKPGEYGLYLQMSANVTALQSSAQILGTQQAAGTQVQVAPEGIGASVSYEFTLSNGSQVNFNAPSEVALGLSDTEVASVKLPCPDPEDCACGGAGNLAAGVTTGGESGTGPSAIFGSGGGGPTCPEETAEICSQLCPGVMERDASGECVCPEGMEMVEGTDGELRCEDECVVHPERCERPERPTPEADPEEGEVRPGSYLCLNDGLTCITWTTPLAGEGDSHITECWSLYSCFRVIDKNLLDPCSDPRLWYLCDPLFATVEDFSPQYRCAPGERRCVAGGLVQHCRPDGLWGRVYEECENGCEEGASVCLPPPLGCQPEGASQCSSEDTSQVCSGAQWSPSTLCENGCDPATGACRPEPPPAGCPLLGAQRCNTAATEVEVCDGTDWRPLEACPFGCDPAASECAPAPAGCGVWYPGRCEAYGGRSCNGFGDVLECRTNGLGCLEWQVADECAEGCSEGACLGSGCSGTDLCGVQGANRCADAGRVETCQPAGDGCLRWTTPPVDGACGANEVCAFGSCLEIPCTVDFDCAGTSRSCNPQGFCEPCSTDADCGGLPWRCSSRSRECFAAF